MSLEPRRISTSNGRSPVPNQSTIAGVERIAWVLPGAFVEIAEEDMDLTVVGYFSVDDGLGSMAEYIVLGAAREGHSVNVIPLGINLPGSTDELRQIIARSRPEPLGPVLYHTWP